MASAVWRPIPVKSRGNGNRIIAVRPAHKQTWGPELWPEEVRQNVEEWPPRFRDRELIAEIRTQFLGEKVVVILSGKNGSGKTTMAQALRTIFSAYRRDQCTLLDDADALHAKPRRRKYLRSSLTLFDLAADADEEMRDAVLDAADHIVLVAAPVIDSLFASSALLDDLHEAGYQPLTSNATVALNKIRRMPFSDLLNIDRHFAKQCGRVIRINADPRLGVDNDTHLDGIRPSTRTGLFELAATVALGIGGTSEPRKN